jgi:hypothetical protein
MGGDKFDLRIGGPHFGQTTFPEGVEIGRFGVDALVGAQFGQGHIV